MHLQSPHLSVLSYPPFACATSPQNKTHTQTTTITKHRKQLIREAVVCYSVPHKSSLANVHCSESLIWFEISVTLSILNLHQNSSWLSLCCPMSWRSSSFETWGLVCHRSQTFAYDTDFGLGQFLTFAMKLLWSTLIISILHIVQNNEKPWGNPLHPQIKVNSKSQCLKILLVVKPCLG